MFVWMIAFSSSVHGVRLDIIVACLPRPIGNVLTPSFASAAAGAMWPPTTPIDPVSVSSCAKILVAPLAM